MVISQTALGFLFNRNPLQVVLTCAVGTIFGMVLSVAVETWRHNEVPVHIVQSHATLSDDGRWLTIAQSSDVSCHTDTVYLLYPSSEDNDALGPRHYVSIGSSKNGLPYPGAVSRYDVTVAIPPGLSGDFSYIERARVECPPFFFSRYSFTTTPPLHFHLGPNGLEKGVQ